MRLVIAFLLLLSLPAAAQENCRHVGHSIACSKGQSFQNLGNTVYDREGRAWQRQGATSFEPAGTTTQSPAGTTLDTQRGTRQRQGTSSYGSSGRGGLRGGRSILSR